MAPEDFNANGWVIIGRHERPCRFCEMTKRLLDSCGYNYTFFSYDNHPIFKKFLSEQGLTTVPQIYHRGKLVGGYDQIGSYITGLELIRD